MVQQAEVAVPGIQDLNGLVSRSLLPSHTVFVFAFNPHFWGPCTLRNVPCTDFRDDTLEYARSETQNV